MPPNDTPSDAPVNPQTFSQVPHGMGPQLSAGQLEPIDVAVTFFILMKLCDRTEGYATNKWLAASCRVDARTIRRSVRRLKAAGWFDFAPDESKAGRRITRLWPLRVGHGCPTPRTLVSQGEDMGVLGGEDTSVHQGTRTGEQVPEQVPEEILTEQRANVKKTGQAALENLREDLNRLHGIGEGTPDALGLIPAVCDLIRTVIRDCVASKGQHKLWARGVARGEITPTMFWEAYGVIVDKQYDPDEPLRKPAAYFTATLNGLWDARLLEMTGRIHKNGKPIPAN